MLSQADNDFISRVGPGTEMGTLMREYWVPVMLSSEVPTPDCDPVRVLILGEKLIGFRDSDGNVGLIQNLCPHRGASLFCGRNEEGGLRCVYHGWKFDVDGACVDMPNEPAESNFKSRIKATTYPCEERSGMIWAYLGSRETPPPLPNLEPNSFEPEQAANSVALRNCNWLQALEGDIDTVHQGFLHHGSMKAEDVAEGTFQYYIAHDRAPHYVAIDTNYGSMYGGYRPGPPGQVYWRIAHYLFPFYTMPPPGVLGHQITVRAWVPVDDSHTLIFTMGPASQRAGGGMPMHENSTDWLGRYRLIADADNDFLIDREKQRANVSYTGIDGIFTQDQAVTESMGGLLDRTVEHLGSSDMMIIRVRHRLIAAARAFLENKTVPPGVDEPDVYLTRSGGTYLPEDADWIEATEDLRRVCRASGDRPWHRRRSRRLTSRAALPTRH